MNKENIRKSFEAHGFQTSFFHTKEEARDYLVDALKGKTVAFGGSVTLKEMGLYEALKEVGQVFWHWEEPGRETLLRAREAEVYISSANGVSETGVLVNIDGGGNRISQSLYGPRKVYYVVGENKIRKTLEEAMDRAKNIAAPRNAVRLSRKTPCAAAGGDRCYDCNSPERICNCTVIVGRPNLGMQVEIVFIEEELGY